MDPLPTPHLPPSTPTLQYSEGGGGGDGVKRRGGTAGVHAGVLKMHKAHHEGVVGEEREPVTEGGDGEVYHLPVLQPLQQQRRALVPLHATPAAPPHST